MAEGVREIVLGLFIIFLSLAMWRLTSSFWGWAVLFAPGSALIMIGWTKAVQDFPVKFL